MSDTVESTTPLAAMASAKSKPVRADANDAKSRAARQNKQNRNGFDGLLNTFLRREGSGAKGTSFGNAGGKRFGSAKKSASGKSGFAASGAAAKMSGKGKDAVKRAVSKTVPAEEAAPEQGETPVDPEVAAAAAEAAMLIWGILYPDGAVEAQAPMGPDSLSRLMEMVETFSMDATSAGLAGLEGGEIAAEAVEDAIATANASAEMNIDAVLAALEELLDGMPRDALEDALAKTAQAMGLSTDEEFAELAAALGLEAVVVEETDEAGQMLEELEKASRAPAAAVEGERQKTVPLAAENAGTATPVRDILDAFFRFIEESNQGKSLAAADGVDAVVTPDSAATLLDSFAQWIAGSANSKEMKALTADGEALAKTLVTALETLEDDVDAMAGEPGKRIFSWAKENLETLLQKSGIKNSSRNDGFIAGTGAGTSEGLQSPMGGTGRDSAYMPGQTPDSAPTPPAPATNQTSANTASSMLDRLENIERLSEAFKIANRGGVKNLTLMLSPAELGKVMLRVESRDGVVSAFLRVEKPEAAAELTSSLQQLRENLKAQGIELGQLDIRQYNQGQAMGYGDQHHGRNSHAEPEKDSGGHATTAAALPEVGTEGGDDGGVVDASGRLNLFA